jgi:hypothetical protein
VTKKMNFYTMCKNVSLQILQDSVTGIALSSYCHILTSLGNMPSFISLTSACDDETSCDKVYVERGETKEQNAEKQVYGITQ